MSLTWRVCGADSENWTTAVALRGELGNVGDLVHRFGKAAQQRQPVGSQRSIVGHDQYVIEEAIDAGPRRGQRAQCGSVVATFDMITHEWKQLLNRRIKFPLGAIDEQRAVDRRRDFALVFAQYVADPLVCGGEGLGF